MLNQILTMLHNIDDCKGYDNIEIAKGKYELATTWKQAFKQIKNKYNGYRENN
jgi:hypothetical protein